MTLFRQLNSTGSGGSSGPDNFSYEFIASTQTVTVPAGQQMLVNNLIDNQGLLIVDGSVSIVDSDQGFGFPSEIRSGEVYAIGVRRQVLLQGLLDNQGLLENFGTLVLL